MYLSGCCKCRPVGLGKPGPPNKCYTIRLSKNSNIAIDSVYLAGDSTKLFFEPNQEELLLSSKFSNESSDNASYTNWEFSLKGSEDLENYKIILRYSAFESDTIIISHQILRKCDNYCWTEDNHTTVYEGKTSGIVMTPIYSNPCD